MLTAKAQHQEMSSFSPWHETLGECLTSTGGKAPSDVKDIDSLTSDLPK